MPKNIDIKTGFGFKIDTISGTIFSKYPLGTAVLEAPFFLFTHIIIKTLKPEEANGFTTPYIYGRIASVFTYFFLALYFLFYISKEYIKSKKGLLFFFVLLIFGSNLFYSIVWQPCMSHIYSFFLFSVLLAVIVSPKFQKLRYLLPIILLLIFLVRNTNLVAALILLYLYRSKWAQFRRSGWNWFKVILGCAFCLSLLCIYLLYKYYCYKNGFEAYSNETFSNILHPRIDVILFSATNGLFWYTPILFFLIVAFFFGVFKTLIKTKQELFVEEKASVAVLVFFFLLYGSWWYPTLSCGFSHRGLIDFLPILSLGAFASLQRKEFQFGSRNLRLLAIPVLVCLFSTIYLSMVYPGCLNDYNATNFYDWKELKRAITASF